MVSIITLNKGTVELIPVDITDKVGTITDLAPYSVDYRVTTEAEVEIVAWTPVNSKNLMRVFPLIDTTVGTWDEDVYKLYIRVNVPPETPILGPMEFSLS